MVRDTLDGGHGSAFLVGLTGRVCSVIRKGGRKLHALGESVLMSVH